MPEVNQTQTPERVELNVYQCGHSGALQALLERPGSPEPYRLHGPRTIRSGKRVLHHIVTPQDKRMVRRWLGLDDGSDQ